MKQRVLITGASGFVGFHLIEAALKAGYEVYAAVRKSSKVNHLKDLDIQYAYTNFNSVEALQEEIEQNKYDHIIHAAGVTKANSASEYDAVNTTYTVNLAKAAVASKRIQKFVFVSSLAAVGPLPSIEGCLNEESTQAPVTAYGQSKKRAEEALKNIEGLNYVILRPTAVYGPRDKDILIVLKQFANRFEPYIAKMDQHLSFIYVKDLAQACVLGLSHGQREAYLLSDGKRYDRYEMANITKRLLNISTFRIHLPLPVVKVIAQMAESVSRVTKKASALNVEKLNELTAANWICSIDKARQELEFSPKYDLEKGLEETLTWYKANKWL
ncbi:NAD-dependent epimerase/dehydratase family protein [Mucilaginibacter daejeonensis]|uniref:NAD-dependent epimerase/dehydratase family protein n=1 Tax=Mucilaginibacter daejeonensis TaxID=398049 RepID=UPI001D178F0A|nr:NAD-dependent epimerase/dehydratase family protein [Mucilaginibacter daejeonensis]UEG51771.1 NAD-dependent epimerase/dehydratase family protein [Mucilaginibacter daejeonensis]